MNYLEFDRKFNKRICGRIKNCSIIDEDGTIYAQGHFQEMEEWWDTHTTPIRENGKYKGGEIDGKKVMMTHASESVFKTLIEPYIKF